MCWQSRLRLFTFAMAVVLAAGCGDDGGEGGSARDDLPDEIISGFVTEETDSGRMQWRLSAPMARRLAKQNVYTMDKPRIEFFDERGQLKTTLVSENGEYSQDTHDMLAWGDVVVTSEVGDVLETDSLRYLNREDRIVSDSFVKLTRGNEVIITGYGLEADNRLSSVDIKRDVKARIIDEEGDLDG